MGFLGIDTSNYTTSVAFLENGEIIQAKKLLPVEENARGLRQSDAVFAHVKQLGELMQQLLETKSSYTIDAVGVSVSPRDEAGSYMPCFLVGKMTAQSVAAALNVPLYEYSHQSGHIAAALFDTGLDDLFSQEFLAFHISGGTTQCLRVLPSASDKYFDITAVSETLDLHAGQVVDRVGVLLGQSFPCGAELEKLAVSATEKYPVKVAFKGDNCCLSGIENQCIKLISEGAAKENVARFCLDSIEYAVVEMTKRALKLFPSRKLVYAGGVMSNQIIRQSVTSKFDAAFANPQFSADNAAGIAVLCEKSFLRGKP